MKIKEYIVVNNNEKHPELKEKNVIEFIEEERAVFVRSIPNSRSVKVLLCLLNFDKLSVNCKWVEGKPN